MFWRIKYRQILQASYTDARILLVDEVLAFLFKTRQSPKFIPRQYSFYTIRYIFT